MDLQEYKYTNINSTKTHKQKQLLNSVPYSILKLNTCVYHLESHTLKVIRLFRYDFPANIEEIFTGKRNKNAFYIEKKIRRP